MKKTIKYTLLLLWVIFTAFSLTACGIKNSDKQTANSSSIEKESKKTTWKEDAENYQTKWGIPYFYLIASGGNLNQFSSPNGIEKMINQLESFKANNINYLFADEFTSKFKSLNYEQMNVYEKDFINTYIKLIFNNDEWKVTTNNPEKVTSAYTGNYENEKLNVRLLGLTFENLKDSENEDLFLISYAIVRKDNEKGEATYLFKKMKSSDVSDGKIIIETGKENVEYICNKIEPDEFNRIISNGKDFFEFLFEYRNDVYSKARNAELNAEYEELVDRAKVNNSKKTPQIGMSQNEVLNSTWGYPTKKNKDTYSWGETEQWVYDGLGYIYFENGVVTSISER